VERDAGSEREGPPELLRELRVERADPLGDGIHVIDEERAPREVERDLDQRFVEWDQRVREATNSGLVAERQVRDTIFPMIEEEYRLTAEMVRKLSGEAAVGERFPRHREVLAERLPMINEVNREQVELLRRFRGAESEAERDAFKSALLLSINTVAAGLGATG